MGVTASDEDTLIHPTLISRSERKSRLYWTSIDPTPAFTCSAAWKDDRDFMMNGHWCSYSVSDPSGNSNLRGRTCTVSVVLEDAARSQFNGIHVLIVAGHDEKLNLVSIRESIGHMNSPQSVLLPPRHRHLLAKQRETFCGQIALSHPCCVLFEAVDTGDSLRSSITLVPFSQLSIPSHFRVIYDHSYPCSPSNPSLFIHLESTHYFDSTPRSNNDIRCSAGAPAHSVRVVPIIRNRCFCSSLSPEIVDTIVTFAITGKPVNWRRELLSYSLVSKTWAHVIDLFFKNLHVQPNDDKSYPLQVARSLNRWPQRARHIRSFSPSEYRPCAPYMHFQHWLHFIAILRHAQFISDLLLVDVPRSVSFALAVVLSRLHRVRRFYLPKNAQESPAFDMDTIQLIISTWSQLNVLEVAGWAMPFVSQTLSQETPFRCKIEELCLDTGIVTDTQLKRFVCSPVPHLRVLNIHGVRGLSNGEFSQVLCTVAHTLVHLSIIDSPMTYADTGEECALDAMMPKLQNLKYLRVVDNHVTAVSIARKPVCQLGSHTGVQRAIIRIHHATDKVRLDQVEQAIDVTGWNTVEIVWQTLDLNTTLVERIKSAAERRGIIVTCRSQRRPFPSGRRYDNEFSLK